jgi:hypothetical protein
MQHSSLLTGLASPAAALAPRRALLAPAALKSRRSMRSMRPCWRLSVRAMQGMRGGSGSGDSDNVQPLHDLLASLDKDDGGRLTRRRINYPFSAMLDLSCGHPRVCYKVAKFLCRHCDAQSLAPGRLAGAAYESGA